jgi:nucleoporin p58/p45
VLLTRFFTRVTQEMQERLQWYKNTIEVFQYRLRVYTSKSSNTPYSKLSGNFPHQRPNHKIRHKVSLSLHSPLTACSSYIPSAISSTLQTQHAIFVSLAARTAAVDGEVQKVKELYTQLWRAKTGSMRDPFNDLDRGSGGEFGMESIQVK